MRSNKWISGGLVSVIITLGGILFLPSQALSSSLSQRPGVPEEKTGRLDENSQVLNDGSYSNFHPFEGTAGESIRIDMTSEDFDAYLFIVDPDGNSLAENDNVGNSTNARIVVTLPSTGVYQMVPNSYEAGLSGEYTLTWQTATTAQLDENSQLSEDGIYFNIHTFEGEAGESIRVDMASEDLDSHLTILGPDGETLATNDNGGGDPDARAVAKLSESGTHQIIAKSVVDRGATGQYSLTWQPATEIEVAHADAIQRATDLSVQALGLAQQRQNYEEMESLIEETLTLVRQELSDYPRDVARNLYYLALVYRVAGSYAEAELLYEEALTVVREHSGEGSLIVGRYILPLAVMYESQGRYSEAESLYKTVLSIYHENLGEGHLATASIFQGLATLYDNQRKYAEAEPYAEQALEMYREQLGERTLDVADALNLLALIYQAQKRHEEAEPLLVESISIQREITGDHPNLASSIKDLGWLYYSQGRYDEAKPFYKESIDIFREKSGDRELPITSSLSALALLHEAQGEYNQAIQLYENIADIVSESGDGNSNLFITLHHLAYLYHKTGNRGQAVSTLQRGLNLEERSLDINLASLNEAQRQAYTATVLGSTNGAVSLSMQLQSESSAHQLALTTLLRRKGRLLEASGSSLQRLRQQLSTENRKILNDLELVRQQLAAYYFNPISNFPPERVEELEKQENDLSTELARRSASFRAESQPVEIDSVQAEIPADGVLLEYSLYYPISEEAKLVERLSDSRYAPYRLNEPHYAVYLLFPDGRIKAFDLGDAETIDRAVLPLTQSLADRNTEITTIQQQAQALDDLVMSPIRSELNDVERLLISPDSQLNLVPFEVLRSQNDRYLVEDFAISYLNSGRELTQFNLTPTSDNAPVIMAAPRYGQASQGKTNDTVDGLRSIDLSSLTVSPLAWTVQEGDSLSALMGNAILKNGAEATETFLKQMQPPSLLHIATHGIFLSDDSRQEAPSEAYKIPSENPLLRSMLAFADFNSRGSGEAADDGVFTALEASTLNLSGTQLVTLSACETAQGEVVSGEGVYGMRRSFAIAGAESLLMSLWRVEDEGTAQLMEQYYESLLSGTGRSDSLRQIQLEMIASDDSKESHPYRWAAFVLAGDWRPLD